MEDSKYKFLEKDDLVFVAQEQKTNKKFEEISLEKTLKDIGLKLVQLENDKTMSLQEVLALKFFRYVYEHPTPKNIESYAKLTGQLSDQVDLNVNDVTASLFSCKADDKTK